MNHWPIGVLRVRFKDHPDYLPPTWTDAGFERVFLERRHPLGVRGYWETHTLGHVDMSGSHLFDWLTIDRTQHEQQKAPDGTMGPMLRTPIVQSAVDAAEARGWDLTPFHGLVVFCVPEKAQAPFLDMGATSVRIDRGRQTRMAAFVSERTDHAGMVHEVGHAIGCSHTFAANPWLETPLEYGDGACVMGGHHVTARAPVRGFGVDPAYFSRMGPGTSAATLLSYVPGVDGDTRVHHWTNDVVADPIRVRVNARDTHAGPLVHVVDWPDVPDKRYVLEYRRPSGFDDAVPCGLTVHTMMDLAYPSVPNAPIYRARLPVPFGSGATRWKDPQEDFAVRLEEVADDQSWVEVSVGGHRLADERGARIDVRGRIGDLSLVAGGSPVEKVRLPVPPACGVGEFTFAIHHAIGEVTWEVGVHVWGFHEPTFAWSVNGLQLPASTGFRPKRVPGVLALTSMPEPGGTVKTELRPVDLRVWTWHRSGALVLGADPADGNYSLSVEVEVSEKSDPSKRAVSSGDVEIETVVVEMGRDWEEAVTACSRKFQDVNEKYAVSAHSILGHLVDVDADVSRNAAALTSWARRLTASAPGLGALAAHAAANLAASQHVKAMRVRPRHTSFLTSKSGDVAGAPLSDAE